MHALQLVASAPVAARAAVQGAAGGLLQQADHLWLTAGRIAGSACLQLSPARGLHDCSLHLPMPRGSSATAAAASSSSSQASCVHTRQHPVPNCSGSLSTYSSSSSASSGRSSAPLLTGSSSSHSLQPQQPSAPWAWSSSHSYGSYSRLLSLTPMRAISSSTSASAKASKSSSSSPSVTITSSSSSPAATTTTSSSSSSSSEAAYYQRSRLKSFYEQQVARELLLKTKIRNPHHLPKITSIHAVISARDVCGKAYAEKWRFLLPALALEHISGQPVTYDVSKNKYYCKRNLVTGVHVSLRGRDAYDFLEKLVALVLPSQNAFDGILIKTLDKHHSVHFKVENMVNFPDFEDQYEMFEALRVMHLTINMQGVLKSPAYTQLLLTGLGLPLLRRAKVVGGVDEAFVDPTAPRAAVTGAGAGPGAAAAAEGTESSEDEGAGEGSSDEE